MATLPQLNRNEIIVLKQKIAKLQSKIDGYDPRLTNFIAGPGDFIKYGCKVTAGTSENDMLLSLVMDDLHANPDAKDYPRYAWEYRNIAFTKGFVFLSQDIIDGIEIEPADATCPRYDIVWVSGVTQSYGVAKGVPSANPTDPDIPDGAIAIARVYVAAGTTAITNSDITDLRIFWRQIANVDKVDGFDASSDPVPNTLLSLDNNAKFPNSVLYTGSGNGLDADTVDGQHASSFADTSLSNVADSTVLAKVENVDGSGSGLDADKLDGKEGSFYTNASNLNAGTVPVERLSGTYNISITGNADKVDNFDASQTPQANQIPVLNSSGQLSLPFAQTPILVSGQDMMYRVFYVDAINGDDNNDGSESAPFKTIKKACDSVPVGGYGFICLSAGQTFDLDSSIVLQYKSLFFNGYNNNNYIITSSYHDNGGIAWIESFKLRNSKLIFYHATFDLPENTTGLGVSEHDNGLIQIKRESILAGVHFYYCTVNLNYDNNILVSMCNYADGAPFSAVSLYGVTFNINHSNTYFISAHGAPFSLRVGANITTNDNTGNNKTFNDLIAGVVKDTNGIPRNIISNFVF